MPATARSSDPVIETADPGDLDALVALHLAHLPPGENIASEFGEPFVRAVYRWFLASPETVVLVARDRDQGDLLGFTSLADRPYNGPMLRAARREALEGVLRRPALALHPELWRRLVGTVRARLGGGEPVEAGVAHVAFTVVAPEARGQGVGRRLKEASVRACRERGHHAMTTGIHAHNVASQRLNERLGFREVTEKRTARFRTYRLELGDAGGPDGPSEV